MKQTGPSRTTETTPLERVADLTKRILAVPHKEITTQERAYQRKRKRIKKNGHD